MARGMEHSFSCTTAEPVWPGPFGLARSVFVAPSPSPGLAWLFFSLQSCGKCEASYNIGC
jgi:hypothetical protein